MEVNLDTIIHLEEPFQDIIFIEKDHKYLIGDIPSKYSVSQIVKKYEAPFDVQKVSKFISNRDGISQEEVLKKWEFEREYSCHKGTEFHKIIENFLNRKKIKIDNHSINLFFESFLNIKTNNSISEYYTEIAKLVKNFTNFYDWWKKEHILVKSEFVIGDKESSICGTLDNLSFNKKTKSFVIFDYKTNKKIKMSNSYEKLRGPLKHLDQCEYVKYSLQLSLYSYIIESKTSISIPESYIVWVNGKDNYELIKCLDLKKESKIILDEFKKNIEM